MQKQKQKSLLWPLWEMTILQSWKQYFYLYKNEMKNVWHLLLVWQAVQSASYLHAFFSFSQNRYFPVHKDFRKFPLLWTAWQAVVHRDMSMAFADRPVILYSAAPRWVWLGCSQKIPKSLEELQIINGEQKRHHTGRQNLSKPTLQKTISTTNTFLETFFFLLLWNW